LLKTFLRLALASIYKSVDVDIDEVIDMFAKSKDRRLELIDWSKE